MNYFYASVLDAAFAHRSHKQKNRGRFPVFYCYLGLRGVRGRGHGARRLYIAMAMAAQTALVSLFQVSPRSCLLMTPPYDTLTLRSEP